MEQRELLRFKEILKKEERQIRKEIKEKRQGEFGENIRNITGELSGVDNHPADIGSEVFEKSKDMALIESSRMLLGQIEEALEAIENGSYGDCQSCHKPIKKERLEAIPYTLLCVECQGEIEDINRKTDPNEQRPVEEELLNVPFARTFKDDDLEESVIYDGEDAWQDVARYGTSSSPQEIPGSRNFDDVYEDANENVGYVQEIEKLKSNRKH
jgi:YteA family regulatory protein